jgi:DNA-binding response OmpR family regulator
VRRARQRKILLVEDDALLAMDVEITLKAAGYRVIGPAATTAEAMRLLHKEPPDLAVLDLNLGTEMSFPLFDHLVQIGAPFIILTGHSADVVPLRHAQRVLLQKPYSAQVLLQNIQALLRDGDVHARAGRADPA